MSKPRFKLYAEIDTLAHANTIKNNIQTQLVGKDIFEQHRLNSYRDDEVSKNLFIAEWRFNSVIDRDSIRDWIKDQIQTNPQIKTWVLSAKLSWHICSHDDEKVQDCKTTGYAEWVK